VHLREKHIAVTRSDSIGEMLDKIKITPAKKIPDNSPEQRAREIFEKLPLVEKRPKTEKKLIHQIGSYFQKQKLAESEITAVIAAMKKQRQLTVSGTKIIWHQ
jgi:hypothetical protein